jgi:uncharacterized protein DUF6551
VSTDKKYTDQTVSVNDLTIDPEVQRWSFNPRKVEQIVKNFKPEVLDLVTVSRRNAATLIVIDGWHRWEAVRRLTDSTGTLECRVFEGLSKAEEAQMFMDLNPGNQPTALDRYRMRLVIGDATVVSIDKAVHAYGWTVHPIPGQAHLQCVKALERIQVLSDREESNANLLEDVMLVTTRVFGHSREAGTATLLEGIGHFLADSRKLKQFDLDRLVQQLKEYPGQAFGLIGDAQTVARMTKMRPTMAIADQLTKQYNKGLKVGGPSELPVWRRTR